MREFIAVTKILWRREREVRQAIVIILCVFVGLTIQIIDYLGYLDYFWTKTINFTLIVSVMLYMPTEHYLYSRNIKFIRSINVNFRNQPAYTIAAKERYNSTRRSVLFFSFLSFLYILGFIDVTKMFTVDDALQWAVHLGFAVVTGWNLYNFLVSTQANLMSEVKKPIGLWYAIEFQIPARAGFFAVLINISFAIFGLAIEVML